MTPEAERVQTAILADRIRGHLAGISALWPMTAWVPAQRERRMLATPGPRSPANDAAIAARDEARELLGSWALVVAEGRDLRPGLDTADVPGICAWLTPHASWLAEADGLGCEGELGRMRCALGEVSDVARRARVTTLGHPCPHEGCGAPLVGVIREGVPAAVRCRAGKPHQWGAEQWAHLGLTLAAVPAQRKSWERLNRAIETVTVDARYL